jgi:muramoyltetrapeptide carboxypeptidase LdcA involved in peptidoglycan recycling
MLKNLIIPSVLKKGDKVAIVASSWGGPASFITKFNYGLQMLEKKFGLKVVVMPFATATADDIKNNPQKRAKDLMAAFKDDSIKAIISAIGGSDSIRMLPFIDFEVIKNNPKIYMGYSDSTITHFMCLKAGVRSYYGPSVMAGFAENGGLIPFMEYAVKRTLFENDIIGTLKNTDGYVLKQYDWGNNNLIGVHRQLLEAPKQLLINGTNNSKGRLIGGCVEVLEFMKDTVLWNKDYFKGAILFIETSEDNPSAELLTYWLRNYAASGILKNLAGILVGRPQSTDEEYINNQNKAILQVVKTEQNLDIPILINCNFGHTDPQMVMPYGALVEIDVNSSSFSILESGVL